MIVEEVMCRRPMLVSSDQPCDKALTMAEHDGVHFLLVVNGEDLSGVVRACDLRKSIPSQAVGYLATPSLTTIVKTEPLVAAKRLLSLAQVACLTVIDEHSRLQGTLTREDLTRAGIQFSERGVNCCAACGAVHHLIVEGAGRPALCCDCHDVSALLSSEASVALGDAR